MDCMHGWQEGPVRYGAEVQEQVRPGSERERRQVVAHMRLAGGEERKEVEAAREREEEERRRAEEEERVRVEAERKRVAEAVE